MLNILPQYRSQSSEGIYKLFLFLSLSLEKYTTRENKTNFICGSKIPTQCQNLKEFCEVFNLADFFYFNIVLLNDKHEGIFITDFLW